MTDPARERPTIDQWRADHWGRSGACPCGDPIILADTEDWKLPRCVECWIELGEPREEPGNV